MKLVKNVKNRCIVSYICLIYKLCNKINFYQRVSCCTISISHSTGLEVKGLYRLKKIFLSSEGQKYNDRDNFEHKMEITIVG